MAFLPDFISSLLYEKLNKQMVGRVPYALMVALFAHLFADIYVEEYYGWFLGGTIASPIIFLVGNTYFNRKINTLVETGLFSSTGLTDGRLRLEKIMAGKISLLGHVGLFKKKRNFAPAVLAGGFLTAFFSLMIFLFLHRIPIEFEQVVFSIIIGAIFIYYDLLKSPLQIGDNADKISQSPLYGYFEKYALSNSIKAVPQIHPSALRFVGRVLGPVMELYVPKISRDVLIVYCSKALNERLAAYSAAEGNDGILLKNVAGLSMTELVARENSRQSQKIYRATEPSQRDIPIPTWL